MITFSKRYTEKLIRRRLMLNRSRFDSRHESISNNLISPEMRVRLQSEIQFLIKHGYIESFLTVNDELRETIYLHNETFNDLCNRELGYGLSSIINPDTLTFNSDKDFDDAKFFDLIEIILVFSREDKHEFMSKRIKEIFDESGEKYTIYSDSIYIKGETGLRSISALIKDSMLKEKIIKSTEDIEMDDYQACAKKTADIIQYLFSGEQQKTTKKCSEELITKVLKKLSLSSESTDLVKKISDLVQISKYLNNTIRDVRHTDQHTLPVDEPNIYKLISNINIGIAELVILSLPEEYIFQDEKDGLKEKYIKDYDIDPAKRWYISKPKEEEIPF